MRVLKSFMVFSYVLKLGYFNKSWSDFIFKSACEMRFMETESTENFSGFERGFKE